MNDEEKSLAKVVLYRWISKQLRQKQFNVLSFSYPMLQHSDMEGEMAQVQDMLSVIGENLGLSVFSTRCPRFLLEKYGSGCDGHLHERLREECGQQRKGEKH